MRLQGSGWIQQVAVPAARDATAIRITVTGPNGMLATAEHPLQKVLLECHLRSKVPGQHGMAWLNLADQA